MTYYLDTNIISYYLSGRYPNLVKHFSMVPSASICIPSVVIAEIEYGARKSMDYEKTISVYKPFITVFTEAEFSHEAAVVYGQIRAFLAKSGNIIGGNDLLIAATVLSKHGVLVTHNTQEYLRVPGLAVEDWTE